MDEAEAAALAQKIDDLWKELGEYTIGFRAADASRQAAARTELFQTIGQLYPRALEGYIVTALRPVQVFAQVPIIALHTKEHPLTYPAHMVGTYTRQIVTKEGMEVLMGTRRLFPDDDNYNKPARQLSWDMLEYFQFLKLGGNPPPPRLVTEIQNTPIDVRLWPNKKADRPVRYDDKPPGAIDPDPKSTHSVQGHYHYLHRVVYQRYDADAVGGPRWLRYGEAGSQTLWLEKTP